MSRAILLVFTFLLLENAETFAADAVFSADGWKIYFANAAMYGDHPGVMKVLDLDEPTRLKIIVAADSFGGEPINTVDRATDGSIRCLSDHHLARFDPRSETFAPFFASENADETFEDLAVNLKDVLILVSSRVEVTKTDRDLKLICFQPGNPKPLDVFCRRVFNLAAPVFDVDGTLYFASDGDLWEGGVYLELPEPDATGNLWPARGVLYGNRIAPLARRETYVGTPVGTTIREIAPVGRYIYVQTGRWGGSGWGTTLRLDKPAPGADHPDGEHADFIAILAGVKVVDRTGGRSWLCASPNGSRIFYWNDHKYCLIGKNGEPKLLPLKDELF